MRLVLKENGAYLEQFDTLESLDEVVQVISCFPQDGERLIFRVSKDIIQGFRNPTEEKWRDLVIKRTVFEVDECLPFQDHTSEIPTTFLWFCPKGKNELIEAIKANQLFTCAVLHKDKELKDASYLLQVFEAADFDVFDISFQKEEDFKFRVIPNLQALIPLEIDSV
ncbi:hypothetical protein [Sulfoacidibacillus thermotolerans]|uniref:Uncharacterized protein n=1 Tax=Sulfoacidibacillus thermotolerans TaxID=1765684 RepID=A0A2U3CU96_SULT2|nr:hypothetical protein [Sulfoacidibacillus thermotolerans]PWI52585.1 hypothetical protein BM613_14050 [Sulfoacidibacillus thermotolerans]